MPDVKSPITANRLNEAMNDIGITAQELSDKSGVSKASISQYRNGSHSPSNISSGKLAEVLNVNPVWLMGFDAPKSLINAAYKSIGDLVAINPIRANEVLEVFMNMSDDEYNAFMMIAKKGDR